MGVSTKLRGYAYLREAVLLMIQNPMQSITKELYPGVAKQFSSTPTQVERSIRNAIQHAWERRNEEQWLQVFQPDKAGKIARPSNAAFISRLADRLLLDQLQLTMPDKLTAEMTKNMFIAHGSDIYSKLMDMLTQPGTDDDRPPEALL